MKRSAHKYFFSLTCSILRKHFGEHVAPILHNFHFAFVIAFCCLSTSAQQYPIFHYTPNEGLINSRVRDIKQGSKGLLYFITYSGLSVYDGARFTNYGRAEGLANELVNDIAEIAPDSFWVATNTQMLNTLVRGRIGTYQTADGFCPLINRFLKSRDGEWYIISDDGLFLLKGRRFTRLPMIDMHGNDVGKYLDNIIEWQDFFLITPWKTDLNEKLILYNKRTKQVADIYTGDFIYSISKDSSDQIWISTKQGIRNLDPDKLQKGMIVLKDLPKKYQDISNQANSSIYFDSKNNLWLYSKSLIKKITPDLNEVTIASENDLRSSSLLKVFEDREGMTWVATDGNGVLKIRGTSLQLINDWGNDPIHALAILPQGDSLWILNGANNTVHYLNNRERRSFKLNTSMTVAANMFAVGKSLYLLSDQGKMLLITDKNNPDAYQHPKKIMETNEPNQHFGYGVVDPNGSILFVSSQINSNLKLFAVRNDQVIMQQLIPGLPDELAIDHNGRLWLITRNDHLLMYSIHPEDLQNYLRKEKDINTAQLFADPRSITTDNDKNIWIGTRYNGVYKLRVDSQKVRTIDHFSTKEGLTDNFIYNLYADSKNRIWIGTQNGLDELLISNGKYIVRNISRTNNMFQSINRIASGNSSSTWALTNEGSIFRIDEEEQSHQSPPLVLINLNKVNNRPGKYGEDHFSHEENSLVFQVASPSFIDEKSVRYSYLLTGSSINRWSEPTTNANFDFINLSPGQYVLHVRAKFPAEVYQTQEATYSFVIAPPWWQTWWFRSSVLVLLVFLIALFFRSYVKRKLLTQRMALERQQAIQKERTRIATDMHDDLGAGLSRIKFLSETIGMKKQLQQPIEEELTNIGGYANDMIGKMGEIVWALNEKNDSLVDLLSYTRSYAVEYLTNNGIRCQVLEESDYPALFVSGEFRRNVYLSVKEALHNIVKHARANQVTMRISASTSLIISIEDDGIGFDKKQIRPFSNGLNNMQKRMIEIGGSLEIIHQRGTMLILKAPISS